MDPLIPYTGGTSAIGTFISAQESIYRFAQAMGETGPQVADAAGCQRFYWACGNSIHADVARAKVSRQILHAGFKRGFGNAHHVIMRHDFFSAVVSQRNHTATIAGTLLGAGLGSSIGASLDKADMAMYHDTSQRALENAQPGQALPWKNPQTGNYGSVTPSNYYQNSQGQYCREYSQNIVVGGKSEQGFGKACRQPDGSWQIVQ
ncbi:MAG: hypothetical protein EB121_09505 [Alphaproteobacteria bacterium]|nr:hypothetical protein [Alphaproteobacteria bacterium]